MTYKVNSNKVIGLFVIGMVILILFSMILHQENKLLKTVMIVDNDWIGVSVLEQEAESYYNLASLSYEYYEFEDAESNCEMAREYYSLTTQGYNEIKAELISKNINHNLIDIYIKMLEEMITINYNMFEACEYLESASRAYGIEDYDMGGEYIDSMGEKISAHDNAVKRYNELNAEYGIELRKLD